MLLQLLARHKLSSFHLCTGQSVSVKVYRVANPREEQTTRHRRACARGSYVQYHSGEWTSLLPRGHSRMHWTRRGSGLRLCMVISCSSVVVSRLLSPRTAVVFGLLVSFCAFRCVSMSSLPLFTLQQIASMLFSFSRWRLPFPVRDLVNVIDHLGSSSSPPATPPLPTARAQLDKAATQVSILYSLSIFLSWRSTRRSRSSPGSSLRPSGEEQTESRGAREDAKTGHLRQAVLWLFARWLDSIVSCCMAQRPAREQHTRDDDRRKEKEESEEGKNNTGDGRRCSAGSRAVGPETGHDDGKRTAAAQPGGDAQELSNAGEELQQILRLFETLSNCM